MRIFASLRLRLILLVFLAVLPALALTLYNGFQQRHLAAEEAGEEALRLARITANDYGRLAEGANQLLHALAKLPQARGGDVEQCNELLADLLTQYRIYANFGVARPDGEVACSALPPVGRVSLADRPWFKQVLQVRDFVESDYVLGRITEIPSVVFGYPIIDQAGRLRGVAWASLDLRRLGAQVAGDSLPPGTTVTVVDRNGTILTRYPDGEQWTGKAVPDAELIREMQRPNGQTRVLPGLDGVPRLYAIMPLPRPSGVANRGASGQAIGSVSVGIPTAVAYAQADLTMRRDLTLLGMVALMAILAATLFARTWVLRPVMVLLSAAERLGRGDLGARVGHLDAGAELNRLAATLDQMAIALERRETELAAAEARYRTLVEQIPAVTYRELSSSPGALKYISPQIQNLLGFSAQEWLADPTFWQQRIHEADRDAVLQAIATSHATGQPLRCEYRLVARDGHTVCVRDEAVLLFDEAEEASVLQGVMLDITERRRSFEQLRVSAKRAQALADMAQALAESELDLDSVINAIVSACAETIGDSCMLRLLTDSDDALNTTAIHHKDPQARAVLADIVASGPDLITTGVGLEVARTGTAVRLNANDPRDVAALLPAQYRPYVEQFGVRNLLVVPLAVGGHRLGTLGVLRDGPGEPYTPEDEIFMLELAGRAALSLERARLFAALEAELHRRQEVEDMLSQRETSLREALASLRVSEEQFRQLAENISEIFWLVDACSGRVLYASPAYETVTGRSCSDLYGRRLGWLKVVHPDDRRRLLSTIAERRGQPFDDEFRITRTDGAVRWARTRLFWLHDDEGALYRVVGSAEDITERRAANDALARRAREMAALYETSLAINAQLDLPTLLQTILESTTGLLDSPLGAVYLVRPDGQSLELVASRNANHDYHGVVLKFGEGAAGHVAQSGHVLMIADYEHWAGRANVYAGAGFKRVLAMPLKIRDRVIGAITIADTENSALFDEEQIRLVNLFADQAAIAVENARLYATLETTNSQLQVALQARDEMLQNISHELRTPLTHIRGYSEFLLTRTLGPVNEAQQDALGVIMDRTDSLNRMVTGLLTLQTFSVNDLRLETVDINEFVDMVGADWRSIASGRYTIDWHSAEPNLCIKADHGHLRQALDQLFDNALKYTPEGGRLELTVQRTGESARLELADTGIGIPADKLQRIFERFYQIDGSTRRSKGGAGIGLALVRKIVELQGGKVWAESPGRLGGSTFIIELPLS